jgi:ribokinase
MVRSPERAPAAPGARLVVLGSLNLDLVGRAPRIPAPGETVLGDALASFHGGKGGNQAVAAARLGASVVFAGAVGDDAAGEALREGLRREGIEVAHLLRVPGPSGHALITVSAAGENAITVLPGANAAVGGPVSAALEGVGLLLMQMEVPVRANAAWARAARDRGIGVVLNAAPMSAAVRELLPWVDVLIVNEGELNALLGDGPAPGGRGNPGSALARAASLGPPVVVLTLGAAGCAACWPGEPLHRVRGRTVSVVDTTGAGDTFAGALAAARLRGEPWPAALAEANQAAALACTAAGARAGMPTRAQLPAAPA